MEVNHFELAINVPVVSLSVDAYINCNVSFELS